MYINTPPNVSAETINKDNWNGSYPKVQLTLNQAQYDAINKTFSLLLGLGILTLSAGILFSATLLTVTGALACITAIAMGIYSEVWGKSGESFFPNAAFKYLLKERCDSSYSNSPSQKLNYVGDAMQISINVKDYPFDNYFKVITPNFEEAFIVDINKNANAVTVYPCAKKFSDLSKLKLWIDNSPVELNPFPYELSLGLTGEITAK